MFLALIVVIAQLGAQVHAYSHGAPRLGAAADPQRGHPVWCGDCVAFAPLLATAGGTAFPVMPLPARVPTQAPAYSIALPHFFTYTAYRSRAPPAHP